MYIGSVRFYKHLILLGFVLLLFIPSGVAVSYAIANARLGEELQWAKAENLAEFIYAKQKDTEYALQYALRQEDNEKDVVYNFDLEYQNMYPDLNIGDIPEQARATDTIYLTFDDGPSALTEKVLDVLKDKGISATFFIVGKNLETERGKQTLKRIVDEGHEVGIHSYSHVYTKIYGSEGNFLDDFYKVFEQIYKITGKKAEIFRFPGGSINGYSSTIYKELIAEMTRRGFVYYDWNVSSQDAARNTSEKQIYNSVLYASKAKTRSIVLMHDSAEKTNTLRALPGLIDALSEYGYSFEPLTRNVAPIIFGYSD
jgi:peptidoglycan/xylan/chitin deacetylase (PgdA/CDA1 family)